MKYQSKPVVIEAIQYNGPHTFDEMVEAWGSPFAGKVCRYYAPNGRVAGLLIKTPEGEMRADPLDWIIKGTEGEFYPCKPIVFERKYQAVRAADVSGVADAD